jgi:hypothetical protein
MTKTMDIKIDSTLRRQINGARMSDSEREVAMNALRTANLIVDAAEWIVKKIDQFAVPSFLKPSFRH